jgi:hypothetical protein
MARWHAPIARSLGLALFLVAGIAQAEIVQGQLQLQWGDPPGGPGQPQAPHRFRATLVTDDGARYALDPAQARRAAGDLYALANKRVAVEFSQSMGAARGLPQRTVEAIVPAGRVQQQAQPALGRVSAAAAVSGNTRWVTVACKFSDIAAEPKPISFFQGQYGTDPGQLGHYWQEVSYGKINLTGSSAYGWFTLPQPRSHYVKTVDGKDDADLDLLFEDCAAAADPQVNFTGVQGINMMFNENLDGFAWGGGACGPLEGNPNACIRNTWNPPWAFNNLAPLAHEMGHGYGLPHSDNSDGDDDTYDNPWDVMSDGWRRAVSNATYGTLPKHINIYQRERLGWIDAARKQTVAAYSTTRLQINLDSASLAGSANKQMILLTMPAQPDPYAGTVYTVEARKRSGSYEANLAGDAVIIHKLQNFGTAYSIDTATPPANVAENEGSMLKVGETWVAPNESHWVQVEAQTATGFVVSVGPKPRVTGGNARPRLAPSAVSASQPASQKPSQNPAQTLPPPRSREHGTCARGVTTQAGRCTQLVR